MRSSAPLLEYGEVRREIRDLDVIAFEGRGLVSRAISAVTRGAVTHVGLAMWWGDELMLVESREFRGGRAVLLSRELQRFPGRALWYRPRDLLEGEQLRKALRWARRSAGAQYSYVGCLRFLRRIGLPTRSPAEDSLGFANRFCSEHVSACFRIAGYDLRHDLADAETAPAEIVRSPRLELRGRLEVVAG